MSSAAHRAFRAGAPLLLASSGWLAWMLQLPSPWSALAPLALLLGPGWGLLRLLSVIDRRFGILGASLALTPLALGGFVMAGRSLGLAPGSTALLAHLGTLLLCLAGTLRLLRHERRRRRLPPHPAPMKLWPHRTSACLTLVAAASLALLWGSPFGAPAWGGGHSEQAARALSWLATNDEPLHAGAEQPASELPSAAAAALVAAGGLTGTEASQALALAALVATLLLAGEAVSRLRGNRGATRAMLAVLLGLNPLAALVLLRGESAGTQPSTIDPFLDGSSLATALAFVALLLSSTMSVLRRASFHVPRLAGAAAFGLALCRPDAAWLLLPGWIAGIALAHLACRSSPDNDPHPSNPARRPGEPATLRAPFWGLAAPIVAGAVGGWILAGAPLPSVEGVPGAGWALLVLVGPTCLLVLPGVRQLHRSPGREAFFFVGWLAGAIPLALLLRTGTPLLAPRLLALVLAVPMANGALMLIERQRARASASLALLVIFLLVGPLFTLAEARRSGTELPEAGLLDALRRVARESPGDAVLLAGGAAPWGLVELAERALVSPDGGRGAAEALAAGATPALLALRARPGLEGREIWAVHARGPSWPGFQPAGEHAGLSVSRAPVPDVVLVTVPGLRADALAPHTMPAASLAFERGLVFTQAISAAPGLRPGLASLFSGLSPLERLTDGGADPGSRAGDARGSSEGAGAAARGPRGEAAVTAGLVTAFERAGYRSVAVLAAPPGELPAPGWERVLRGPNAEAPTLVDAALAVLADADARPALLWLHVADLAAPEAGDDPAPEARYAQRVAAVDRALARLWRSLPEHALVLLTAPYARAAGPAGTDATRALAEDALRVPLALAGGGLPAGRPDRLAALQDVPALLLRGELPQRERVLLAAPAQPQWGERTARFKTLIARTGADGSAVVGRVFDLAADPGELEPALVDEEALRALQAQLRLHSS